MNNDRQRPDVPHIKKPLNPLANKYLFIKMCVRILLKKVGISKVPISCSSQKARCSHLKCHFTDKLLSERMSQIRYCHLNCHFKCHLKGKLLSEQMSPYVCMCKNTYICTQACVFICILMYVCACLYMCILFYILSTDCICFVDFDI